MDLARMCIFLEFSHPYVMTGGLEARGAPVPHPDDICALERRCIIEVKTWALALERTGSVTFGMSLCLSLLFHMMGILNAPTQKVKSKGTNLATGVEQLLTSS